MKPRITVSPTVWAQFVRVVRDFYRSDMGRTAGWWLVLLVVLLLSISGFNVVNSYVNRDLMSAVSERQTRRFIELAFVYLGVFALSTIVAAFYRFTEERLGLLWRSWLTTLLLQAYLSDHAYCRLKDDEVDNPDERISEDVKTFTVTTLSFLLLILNGTITALSFSAVLMAISPMLFAISVAYAVIGSILTVLLGRGLVGLNSAQLQKEANFRFDIIHVREHAESIALLRAEPTVQARLLHRLADLVANNRAIITVNRNLGFFTIGYNYLIQLIPIAFIAPSYIRGEIEFGVLTQATMVFAQLVGAFSLIVTQFQQISSFAAVVGRLTAIAEAIERARHSTRSHIQHVQDNDQIAFEQLTLRQSPDGPPLIRNLSASTRTDGRLLIGGKNDVSKHVLFQAIAGLWDHGEGQIICPENGQIAFLPERPYLVSGTLRDQFLRNKDGESPADSQLASALDLAGLASIAERFGGLTTENDWQAILSPAERILLSFARVLVARPSFVVLDQYNDILSIDQVKNIYRVLSQAGIPYISIADDPQLDILHDKKIYLEENGAWHFVPLSDSALPNKVL